MLIGTVSLRLPSGLTCASSVTTRLFHVTKGTRLQSDGKAHGE